MVGPERKLIMASYNKVIMAGNLTRDPELKYLQNNTPVVEFGLAVNREYKAKDGEIHKEVCFIDCNAYGGPAETLSKYVAKGSPLLIDGRLKLDTWEANGYKHSKHRVIIESFQFLPETRDRHSDSSVGSGSQPNNLNDDIPF